MDKKELKKFVNKILEKKGHPPVKEFAKEFNDGSKYNSRQYLNPTWLSKQFVLQATY
jgi:hypothetical protein